MEDVTQGLRFSYRSGPSPEGPLMSPLAHGILTGVVALGAVLMLPTLVRKPAGWPGKLSLWLMNSRHSAVTDWGLGHVAIAPAFTKGFPV